MKKMDKILGLVLGIALLFTSCGSDDDGPTPVLKTEVKSYTYTTVIKGLAPPTSEGKIEYTLPDLRLSDILGEENAKNFVAAEFQNTGTYMEVEGIKKMESKPELKNFTLQVDNTTPVNFGTCKAENIGKNEFFSDVKNSSNTYVNFINTIFNRLISSNKKVSLKISFTPTQDILEQDEVYLHITINAHYKYNTYPNNN